MRNGSRRCSKLDKLVITPLAFIRGRSLQRTYFIVDEAQNLTPHEVKTIITRAGDGTKIVFTGDVQQIDHPYLDSRSNGLSYLISRMVGQPLYAHITLEKGNARLWRIWPASCSDDLPGVLPAVSSLRRTSERRVR